MHMHRCTPTHATSYQMPHAETDDETTPASAARRVAFRISTSNYLLLCTGTGTGEGNFYGLDLHVN